MLLATQGEKGGWGGFGNDGGREGKDGEGDKERLSSRTYTPTLRDLCDLDNTHGQDSDNFWCILVPDLMAADGK